MKDYPIYHNLHRKFTSYWFNIVFALIVTFSCLSTDMRKALSRDTEKKSIIPLPHPVRPEDIE